MFDDVHVERRAWREMRRAFAWYQTRDEQVALRFLDEFWRGLERIAEAAGDAVVKTPTFDRIAETGVFFSHAFSCAPSCTPSRNGLLTGQEAFRAAHHLQGGLLGGLAEMQGGEHAGMAYRTPQRLHLWTIGHDKRVIIKGNFGQWDVAKDGCHTRAHAVAAAWRRSASCCWKYCSLAL